MTGWVIFAPTRFGDEALANSAAVAERHRDIVPGPTEVVTGPAATRAALEACLDAAPWLDGVAFFGHGNTDRLFDATEGYAGGPHGVASDAENLHRLAGRWVHAFACLSGVELADVAAARGVTLYAGYRVRVNASWVEPPPAESEFSALVTALTRALVNGERDPVRLRRAAAQASDAFIAKLTEIPDLEDRPDWMALHILAATLVDELVLSPPTPPETPPP